MIRFWSKISINIFHFAALMTINTNYYRRNRTLSHAKQLLNPIPDIDFVVPAYI